VFLLGFPPSTATGARCRTAVMQVDLNGLETARPPAARYRQFDGRHRPFDLITGLLIKDVIPFGHIDVAGHADTTIKTIVVVNVYHNLRSRRRAVYFPRTYSDSPRGRDSDNYDSRRFYFPLTCDALRQIRIIM